MSNEISLLKPEAAVIKTKRILIQQYFKWNRKANSFFAWSQKIVPTCIKFEPDLTFFLQRCAYFNIFFVLILSAPNSFIGSFFLNCRFTHQQQSAAEPH